MTVNSSGVTCRVTQRNLHHSGKGPYKVINKSGDVNLRTKYN